tara:strand:+ start:1644 stop:1859 length:216 start_codon:yes stop_codon:yes gene_type:complete
MAEDNKVTINLLDNGEFASREVTSSNVGELRNELEIPSTANVMVAGTIRQNDFNLEDGALVAYASNNKVGG